jgi:hypothetical protein
MKTKFKHDELAALGFKEYRNLLFKDMARLKKDIPDGSKPVDFVLIGKFKYTDTGEKEVPLVVIGDLDPSFTKYVKEVVLKRKERDFAVGTCGFGKEGQFNVVIKKGKFPSTITTLVNKLLFQPAGLSLSVVEKLEEDDEKDGGKAEAPAVVVAPNATESDEAKKADAKKSEDKKGGKKTKEEKIAELKEQATSELTALSGILTSFKASFAELQKKVAPKLKSEEGITKADMISIKKVSDLCDEFDAACKKAGKAAQKEVAKGEAEVKNARKELQKFAAVAQQKKVSLAQTLADKFFLKNAKRAAKEAEVKLMQTALQTAIADSKMAEMKPADKALTLKAMYLTATLLGPKFGYAQVQIVANKLKAA